jgi:hypothetical protein
MLVKGDVKCLHCGHISGQWTGQKGTPLLRGGLKGPDGTRLEPTSEAAAVPLRCGRCEGPVFLDDSAPVISPHRLRRIQRMRAQIAAIDRRRGAA